MTSRTRPRIHDYVFNFIPPHWSVRPSGVANQWLYVDPAGRPRGYFDSPTAQPLRLEDVQPLTRLHVTAARGGGWRAVDRVSRASLFHSTNRDDVAYWLSSRFPRWQDPSAYWDKQLPPRKWWRRWLGWL